MKHNTLYCGGCCSTQRTIRDRAGLRCSACERLLRPTQHSRRHQPVNVSHSRMQEFAAALHESLDLAPVTKDYFLTPNGGRFPIEAGSIADRCIRGQEVV